MAPPPPLRYDSVDALRGLAVAAMLLVNDPGSAAHVYAPLRHAGWEGYMPADFIFPLFLFVVGVSIAFARERLTDAAAIARALRIVGLGLVLHALAYLILDQAVYRIPGVLQRVGLCYGFAALLALHTRRATQWIVIAAILLGYWAWMGWGDPYTLDNRPDPEGLSSTPPAIATTLLGLRAGEWLREERLRPIAACGIAALLLGELWSQVFPLNKTVWTSSYVLWSAGWSMLALAAADMLIDQHRWPAVGRSLGRNAIAIYAAAWIAAVLLDAARWRGAIFAALARALPSPELASLVYGIAFTAIAWLAAFALARRGTYIRI